MSYKLALVYTRVTTDEKIVLYCTSLFVQSAEIGQSKFYYTFYGIE